MYMSAEHRSKCSPSTAMVTSAYKWTFSSETKNSKQTNKLNFIHSFIDLLYNILRLSGNRVSEISIQKQNAYSILHFLYLITILFDNLFSDL